MIIIYASLSLSGLCWARKTSIFNCYLGTLTIMTVDNNEQLKTKVKNVYST